MQTTIVKVKVGEDFACPICGAEYSTEWYDKDAGMVVVGYWEETGRCPHLPSDYEIVGEDVVEFVFTDCDDNCHNDQVRRESDHAIDGVPAAYEAALQAFYRGDQPICPFCGQRYRELEAEGYTLGEIIIVTLWRCKCGVFPVKAEVLRD
jgi:RNA polymerase subunit RPABC4/transcription elongation factor Spt4